MPKASLAKGVSAHVRKGLRAFVEKMIRDAQNPDRQDFELRFEVAKDLPQPFAKHAEEQQLAEVVFQPPPRIRRPARVSWSCSLPSSRSYGYGANLLLHHSDALPCMS